MQRLQLEQSHKPGDDQIQRHDVVEQTRYDQNQQPGDHGDKRLQCDLYVHENSAFRRSQTTPLVRCGLSLLLTAQAFVFLSESLNLAFAILGALAGGRIPARHLIANVVPGHCAQRNPEQAAGHRTARKAADDGARGASGKPAPRRSLLALRGTPRECSASRRAHRQYKTQNYSNRCVTHRFFPPSLFFLSLSLSLAIPNPFKHSPLTRAYQITTESMSKRYAMDETP
jgi:hypothetical protein